MLACAFAIGASPAAALAQVANATGVTPTVAASAPVAPAAAKGGTFTLSASAAGRVHAAKYDSFAADHQGTKSANDLELGSRVIARVDVDIKQKRPGWRLQLRGTAEVAHGVFSQRHVLIGDKLPPVGFDAFLPTELWLAASYKQLAGVRFGQMTSQWGTGMLANDGFAMLDERRDDWFALSQVGDRVNRLLVWTRPFAEGKSALRGLALFLAADRVVQDDIVDPEPGAIPWAAMPNATQKAEQVVAAARMYLHEKRWVGLYYVMRQQEHADGKSLTANAIDLAADLDFRDANKGRDGLHVTAEAVTLFGKTTLGPSPEFPEHDIAQVAFSTRARWTSGKLRLELDGGYFSGDPSTDDATINNFKADPNFQQGMVLFRRVLAWQSGRARLTASNLDIVGRPNEDLDRLATDGSVTNSITIFPKAGIEPIDGLQIYGGVLFAFADAALVDPFHTRTLGGGEARNYLAAKASDSLLGTELDVGIRYRLDLFGVSSLWLRGEYAVLMPGGALQGAADELGNITGWRLSIATGPGSKRGDK